MKLLKGKNIADKIISELKRKITEEKIKPGLAVILVGKNSASEIYANLKGKAAKKIGIGFYLFKYGNRASENDIIGKIKELNADKKISGIIVQLPLPKKLNTQNIIKAIDPKKDADGFHPENLKLFLQGKEGVKPVFPMAIVKISETIPKVQPSKNLRLNLRQKAVIIANSEMFGKIMLVILEKKGISTERILLKKLDQTDYYTRRRPTLSVEELKKIKNADIVISALGIPGFIKGSMIKKNAVIIDGGIAKKGKRVMGDADYKSVKNIASYLSPVPGGVGPVTVACLLENVCMLAKKKI